MRDGNLAAASKYIASLYDDYGRVTATGYWSGHRTGCPDADLTDPNGGPTN